MGSFTSPPIVTMHGLKEWELFTPFSYYRNPVKDVNGNVKDPKQYTTEEKVNRTFERVVVPRGFKTDLATIPRILWSIWPPHDYYAKAAILHDYLYENAIGSKKEADLILYEALGVLGMPRWQRKLFYWGARLLGKGNYK